MALCRQAPPTEAEAQEACRARVWAAYQALVQALAAAGLEELDPRALYEHSASAVLLRGSLLVRGHRASLADGLPPGTGLSRGQGVIPQP